MGAFMPSTQEIETFLASYSPEVGELLVAARLWLAKALPKAEETLDESAKVIGYGYGPGYKGCVCTLILSRTQVKLGIVHGSELPDPDQLLQGKCKIHRYVAVQTLADLERPSMKPLIGAALAAWRERTKADR